MASSPAVPDLTGAAVAFHIRHISRDGLGKHTSLYFARVWDLGLADQGYSRARTDRHVVIKAFPSNLAGQRAFEKESNANLKIGSCSLQANAVQELLEMRSDGNWPRCFGQMRVQSEALKDTESRFEPDAGGKTGLRCLVFEHVAGLKPISRDDLTDKTITALVEVFEELHEAGIVFNNHIDHAAYPKVALRNIYRRINGDPFISDFQCASEAKLDQRGDKMKSDEMAGLKDYLHRMRDGKDAVDTIPREVQILLESAA